MYSLEIITRLNAAEQPAQPPYELCFHPRLLILRHQVNTLPVDQEYRRWLRYSLWKYAEKIIAREEPPPDQGWDDLEALQQVALGDWNEAMLQSMCIPGVPKVFKRMVK